MLQSNEQLRTAAGEFDQTRRQFVTCRLDELRPHPGGALVLRSVDGLRKHPAYAELKLTVSPAQLAALKKIGELVFKDPLLVTREGLIIDGYARKEYADRVGISTLLCVEIDADIGEALRLILSKHRRSPGWNEYNRIRMASRLKESFRELARSNQQAGGHFKGSSKLTEASVRKRLAETAGVCEGNVTKYDQMLNSDPQILDASKGRNPDSPGLALAATERRTTTKGAPALPAKNRLKATSQDPRSQASSKRLFNTKPSLAHYGQSGTALRATIVHAVG